MRLAAPGAPGRHQPRAPGWTRRGRRRRRPGRRAGPAQPTWSAPARRTPRQPLLRQALRHVAHPTIRNRGTTVGSLVHADPAGEMPAVLALLGGSVVLARRRGERDGRRRRLLRRPAGVGARARRAGRRGVRSGGRRRRTGSAFVEVARRHGDYALCGVARRRHARTDDRCRLGPGRRTSASAPTRWSSTSPTRVRGRPGRRGGLGRGGRWPTDASTRRRTSTPPPTTGGTSLGVLTARALRGGAAAEALRGAPGRRASRARGPAARQRRAAHESTCPARRLLSDSLRHDLGLTGTHVGCEHGVCGACTVLLDGEPVRVLPAVRGHRRRARVTTVEGSPGPDGSLHPVQRAFMECHGLQCGFCTPGFLTTVDRLPAREPATRRDDEAREAIAGNLCRCTGYQNIVASVLRAAELRREGHGGADPPRPREAVTTRLFGEPVQRREDRPAAHRRRPLRRRPRPRRPGGGVRAQPARARPDRSTSTSTDALDVERRGRDLHLRGPADRAGSPSRCRC